MYDTDISAKMFYYVCRPSRCADRSSLRLSRAGSIVEAERMVSPKPPKCWIGASEERIRLARSLAGGVTQRRRSFPTHHHPALTSLSSTSQARGTQRRGPYIC